MGALPVIVRELLVASRRRATWHLRLTFALGLGLAFLFGLLLPEISLRQRGQVVLRSLSIAGFVLALAAGPYLTADAISSERREGTLGLLFLTPLNGLQIVLGKMTTHSLQVFYAVIGTFPFLFLPVLLGGVFWAEILRVLVALLTALLVSLAVGILWSVVSRDGRHAPLATAITMPVLVFAPRAWSFVSYLFHRGINEPRTLGLLSPMTQLNAAFESVYRSPGAPGFGAHSGALLFWSSTLLLLALSTGCVLAAGLLLPRSWQRESPRVPAAPESGNPPAATTSGPSSRAPRSRRPAHPDPTAALAWLGGRDLREPRVLRWTRRAAIVFFGAMLLIAITTSRWQEGFLAACFTAYGLHLLVRIQASWMVTRWLHDDRRSGALELLLTTPLEGKEIVAAHHAALLRAFRPLLVRLLALNGALEAAIILCWEHLHMDHHAGQAFSIILLGGAAVTLADFTALRWLGLRESLRPTNTTPARAAGRTLAPPMIGGWLVTGTGVLILAGNSAEATVIPCFAIIAIAHLALDVALVRNCQRFLQPGIRTLATREATGTPDSSAAARLSPEFFRRMVPTHRLPPAR